MRHQNQNIMFATAGLDEQLSEAELAALFATGEYEIGYDDAEFIAGADESITADELSEVLAAMSGEYEIGAPAFGRLPRLNLGAFRNLSPARRAAPVRAAAPRLPAPRPSPGRFVVRKKNPTTGRVLYLGFDSGANIAAGASQQVSSNPQDTFAPTRIIIPATIAPAFTVDDLKVGNVSQLVASGPVPGELFAQDATASEVAFDTAQVSQVITFLVTNISAAPARFRAGILGKALR